MIVSGTIGGPLRRLSTAWPSYGTLFLDPKDIAMTPPGDPDRLRLHDDARTALGEYSANTLMASLPPTPFPDLAARADLLDVETRRGHRVENLATNLRAEIQLGVADLRTELKDDMHTGFAQVDANMRTQLYWMIGTMIAIFGVLAALIVALA